MKLTQTRRRVLVFPLLYDETSLLVRCLYVQFRKLKTNEIITINYGKKHQTSKKEMKNLRLCPYNVNDDGLWAVRANSPQETNYTRSVEHIVFSNLAKHVG